MEPAVLFIVASLTLIVPTIAVVIPTAVHTDSQWCVNGDLPCFHDEHYCKKIIFGTEGAKCVKVNQSTK
ncbi:MAG: hypothetical protein ACR2KF_03230 [Nitrososphaeraceae archaeon]